MVEASPKAAKGKEKVTEKLLAKPKGKEKVMEESPKKEEGKGRNRQFPNLLLEMEFFLEDTPIPAYIFEIIDHHGWQDFCVCPSLMQPMVVRAFYKGEVDQEEDMVVAHNCEVSFNSREINAMFSLRDKPDAKSNRLIANTSHEHMQTQSG